MRRKRRKTKKSNSSQPARNKKLLTLGKSLIADLRGFGSSIIRFLKKICHYFFFPVITNEQFHRDYQQGRRNFSKLKFEGVNLDSIPIRELNLQYSDLRNCVNLKYADLTSARFPNVNLNGVDLSGLVQMNINFTKTKLRGANFNKSNLQGAIFTRAVLTNASLNLAYMPECNFSSAQMTGAGCADSVFTRTNFSGANLFNANLSNTIINSGNLSGANVISTNLSGADLSGCTLKRVSIWKANYELTDFNNTDYVLIMNNLSLAASSWNTWFKHIVGMKKKKPKKTA